MGPLKQLFIVVLGSGSLLINCSQAPSGGGRKASVKADSNKQPGGNDRPDGRGDSTVAVNTNGQELSLDPKMQQPDGPKAFSSRSVVYGGGIEGSRRGFYLRPQGNLNLKPAILAVHGRSGLNDEFKKMLQWFVGAGYPVLAVDLYNGAVPESFDKSDDLEKLVNERGEAEVLANILQGAEYLFNSANASAVFIVGWDRGGKWAIDAVLQSPNRFVGLINYYGNPLTLETNAKKLQRPFLDVQLDDHQDIPWASIEAVHTRLNGYSKEVTLRKVQGAKAGFLDPSRNPDFFAGLLKQPEGQPSAPHVAVLRETLAWIAKIVQATPAK